MLTFPRSVMAAKSLASASASDCRRLMTVPHELFCVVVSIRWQGSVGCSGEAELANRFLETL